MHRAITTAVAAGFVLAVAMPAAAQVYGQPYGGLAPPAAPYGQQPAPGVYAPQTGYGAPAAGTYGAPQPGYGAPAYGAPAGAYGAPQSGYGQPSGAYAAPPPGGYAPPTADIYGANAAYVAPPKCDNTGAIVGGLVGAVGGGVLGSNVAGHGDKTEGTVLGGVVGGGLGALVGHAHDKHQCDKRGAYWSYKDTTPYPVGDPAAPDPRAAEYVSRGCRLAPAAANGGQETRYVRVCPDSQGRFRIVG